MTWWQAILLGALQGITEFLPISSSGHLVLAQHFLEFPANTAGKESSALFFDGVLHLGTMLSVLLYFRRDITERLRRGNVVAKRIWPSTPRELTHLGVLIVLATIPAAFAALQWSEPIKESFTNPKAVAGNFFILGLILLIADRVHGGVTTGPHTRWWQALVIGMAQAASAVFRGLSRSGLTVSAALFVGLQREWAVRFSFMMSVVASLGLGGLGIVKAVRDPQVASWMTPHFLLMTAVGTVVSAVVGYLTIDPLIRLVRRSRLWWFCIYLWLVGAIVLSVLNY